MMRFGQSLLLVSYPRSVDNKELQISVTACDGFDSSLLYIFFHLRLFWGLTRASGGLCFSDFYDRPNSTVLAINDFNIQKVGVPWTSCTYREQ